MTKTRSISAAIRSLLSELQDNPTALSVRENYWEIFHEGEKIQIQLTITRDKSDFLEPMQVDIVEPFRFSE